MINDKLSNISVYITIAREVSKSGSRHLLITIIKMIIAKIYHDILIKDYAINDIERIPFKFWKNFMNKKSLTDIQKKLNPDPLRKLVNNKIEFYIRCLQNDLPTPKVWAIICNNRGAIGQIPKDTQIICDKKELYNFLHIKEVPKDLIIKLANGAYSKGLISLRLKHKRIFDSHDRQVTIEEIYNHCFIKHQNEACIVQERLNPHPDLKPLMPGKALGCIRVVTYSGESKASVLLVFIKIPVGKNITDNFRHGNSGNLVAYLDINTGKLGKAWGKRPNQDIYCLSEFTRHPTTGAELIGFQIPQWGAVKSLAKQSAKAFPELRAIGWDVALCRNGVFIMEGNRLWDPTGFQITLKRGIKKEMMALV